MESRVQLFQTLKPVCTRLTEATVKFNQRKTGSQEVVDGLCTLLESLQQARSTRNALDKKYADYVFFPLIGVLRDHQRLPIRALELTLLCISNLLETGWKSDIEPKIALQLLIFCTVVNENQDVQNRKIQTSEELRVYSFKCVQGIFISLGETKQGRSTITEAASIPFIGKAVSVILDGASEGLSADIQLAAILALQAFCNVMPDNDALAVSFLPGVVSCMTRILTPSTQARRNFRQYENALDLLNQLLARVLSDEVTRSLPEETTQGGKEPSQMTKSWLRATAGQIKISLSQVVKLRQHDKVEVRRALSRLCATILEKCPDSLPDSVSMVLETIVTILSIDQDMAVEIVVNHLLSTQSKMGDLLRSSLRQWIVALPRVMQGHDDNPKRSALLQISTTIRILNDNGVDASLLQDSLAASIRDSVACIFLDSENASKLTESTRHHSLELMTGSSRDVSESFDEVLISQKSQEDTVKSVRQLIMQLSEVNYAVSSIDSLVSNLQMRQSTPDQLATFWFALNYLRSIQDRQGSLEDFMDSILLIDTSGSVSNSELLDELYSFSLSVLTDLNGGSNDWRLQALSLETLALQAKHQGQDFRGELVESLYPVVHLVGSNNKILRDHAITALNMIAKACDYADVGDLIVSNVDYLVNAVALKLNTFDISPQAPLVLLMMIKLTGPSLIPHLDDLVDSMFAALDNHHGYPMLVELLFKVLKGITEEGAKNPQLAITTGEINQHEKQGYTPIRLSILAKQLQNARIKRDERERKEVEDDPDHDRNFNESDQQTQQESTQELASLPPPQPKTYNLLLNISRLTQHYMTAASPTLRNSLLGLLQTSFPALARHEDSFLPLINTLWPVLVSRLNDPEPYVVVGALDSIGLLCTYAGDFMRSRIESLWPEIKILYHARGNSSTEQRESRREDRWKMENQSRTIEDVIETALTEKRAQGDGYSDSPVRLIRDGIFRLISATVSHTTVEESTFDEMLELTAPILEQRADVKKAMESHNPDAVWLSSLRVIAGQLYGPHPLKDMSVPSGASVPPAGKRGWVFAEVIV